MSIRTTSTTGKLLASAAVVGVAAAIAGLGTFGTFTSTTSASQQISTGTVAIELGAAGTATNRLTVNATGLVPGDSVQRQVALSNTGNQNLSGITLTTTASTSSLLDTDATNGLQLTITACSVPWTEAGTAPAYTYTCGGTTTTILAARPVLGSAVALGTNAALTAGATANLVVRMTFPTAADNTFQAKSSTIVFSFTGTQRVATDR